MSDVSVAKNDGAAFETSTATCSLALEKYYRFHSLIYDATRWSFLFGRSELISICARNKRPRSILEVGCGTGKNLCALQRTFPTSRLMGVDLSRPMLDKAGKALGVHACDVELLHRVYDAPLRRNGGFDLIVLSYALTMINPGLEHVLDCALKDLAPDGKIAVVDFHDTPARVFASWMQNNHVRMQGQVLSALEQRFTPVYKNVRPVYGGLWRYFHFLGAPKDLEQ